MTSNATYRGYTGNMALAPVANNAQLQSGYNPHLLVEKAAPPQPSRDLEAGGTSPPFYRTRKGIIIIAVVALVVIIAAALGGGVGAKKKKKIATFQPASTRTSTQGAFLTSAAGNSQGGGVPDSISTTPGTSTTISPGLTTTGIGHPLTGVPLPTDLIR